MKRLYNIRNHGLCMYEENGDQKQKNSQKLRLFKTSFKKTMKPNFFDFFRQKSSLGSCATFSENMVSISIVGFERFGLKFEELAVVTKSSKKNLTLWAPHKARAPKRNITSFYGDSVYSSMTR